MIQPIPILLYHSVSDDVSPKFHVWRVSVNAFAKQMALLASKNYNTLTVSELVTRLANPGVSLPERTIVVTFDDALCDFYYFTFPMIRKYNIPTTLYIPTSYVGHTSRWLAHCGLADYPMMNWEELKEVSGNGVECGGHTHTHVPLDLISEKLAFGEITRCKQELEQHLQRPINTFAYPSGYYNGNVQDQVIQAGFSNACAVKNALSHTGDDVYALARVCITPNMSLADFERVTLGRSPRLVPRKERLRTKLWRQTRRLLMRFDK